jgi:PAS domain S-box-containing protein
MEKSRIEDEQQFRYAFDHLLEGVQMLDFSWRFTYVNDALVKHSTYTREELIGYTMMEKYPGIEQTPLFQVVGKCMTERVSELLETEFIFPNGTKSHFQLSIQPIPQGILILWMDITERKRAEESVSLAEINYRELFDSASDGIYVMDLKSGFVIDANQKASEITGYAKEELQCIRPQSFVLDRHPEESARKIIDYLQKVAEGVPQRFEWWSKRKDGTNTWLEVELKKVCLAGENRILAFFREIDERKKGEEEIRKWNEELERKVTERTVQLENHIFQLKESEEKFQKAFQSSVAGIAMTSFLDGKFLDVNDAFVDLLGYPREEIIGKNTIEIGMIVHSEGRELLLKEFKERGSAKNFEIELRHKSGKIISTLSSAERISLRGGEYIINIIFDITERKRAEEQLRELNKELEAFTYSVSHDLRAPLRVASGYAQILKEDFSERLDEEGKRIIDIIKNNTTKMGGLIDDLLAFARLGRQEVRKTNVDMGKLVDMVIQDLHKSSPHQAKIRIGPLHEVKADYGLLYQVMLNLISNAIKYSSKKEDPFVEISSSENEAGIVFHIRDNGTGFDMNYAHKLFGVFQRLHKQEEFEGTGVGLAIVRRIIDKHGGRVWANGKVGEGADFYFVLEKI